MKDRIVVDANILFSALLKKGNPYIKVLMNANCKFFGPTFVFIELFKHKEKIQKYSSLSEEELLELLGIVLDQIEFISKRNRQTNT